MIELTLVCGFLGAGKTTWLDHHLRGSSERLDLLIVNDFAEEGIDHLTLRDAGGTGARVEAIVGGCVCCSKLEELRAALSGAVDRSHRGGVAGRSRVVVETSGLAEPHNVVRLLSEDPVLRTNVMLHDLVVVLDGVGGRRTLRHRAAARAQVGLADRVVIARADLVDAAELAELAGIVRVLTESATITVADHGMETPIEAVAPTDPQPFDDAADDLPIRSLTTSLGQGTSWAEYAVWLDAVCRAHPDGLLRSKGLVPTSDGPLLVQSMGADVALPVAADVTAGSSMVFILSGIDPDDLARSLTTFVPSAVATDTSVPGRSAD
ncbi:MAG: hypothetical protein QOG20_866 [Pseudonocardiales bacterium]|nr:hypothetical protein [Pseudonocardiales bacterium]